MCSVFRFLCTGTNTDQKPPSPATSTPAAIATPTQSSATPTHASGCPGSSGEVGTTDDGGGRIVIKRGRGAAKTLNLEKLQIPLTLG